MGLLAILTAHASFLAWIAARNAPVCDEIAHLPAGLSHWKTGNFDLYRVNPPLMRMIASAPLLGVGPKVDWSYQNGDYARPEFEIGKRFMEVNGNVSLWYFTICRWTQIPVSVFGAWICFRWSKDLFGLASGFVAVILWSFCPNMLTWGSTITPDIGAAAFGVAAAYAFWKWLAFPTWSGSIVAGIAMGLAELSKSIWIILFIIWPALWYVHRCQHRQTDSRQPTVMQLTAILVIGLHLVNLGYGFESTFSRLDSFKFISHTLGGPDAHTTPGNRFQGTLLGRLPVPVPANYLRGIDTQKYDFETAKKSYLRGEQKIGGWWYYYLYALVIKSPTGTLILLAVSVVLAWSHRDYATEFRNELHLLMPAMVVLALVSSQTGFNRYLRYVLPSLPCIYIFIGRVGVVFHGRQLLAKCICAGGLTSSIVESANVFPHSMSFFNLAVGGPFGGPEHLLDANIDWGQDLLFLKRYVDRHPEMNPVHVVYVGCADARIAGMSEHVISQSNPATELASASHWYAVSVNYVYNYNNIEASEKKVLDLRALKRVDAAGYSIYIYRTQFASSR